jgi:uncharacterized protein YcfL
MEKNRSFFEAFLWMLLICIAAFSGACAKTTVSNVAVGQITEGEEGETLKKDYVIKDKTLAKEIQVVDVKARFQGDFLEGQAILSNLEKSTVPFEYRFEWFDAEGFPIESNVSLWKPDLLYGKETKWIKALCPVPNAKGFKVMIREPNPVEE